MTFSELPADVRERLTKDVKKLAGTGRSTAYTVDCYDATGKRHFIARRCTRAWADDKGNSMPFGGGSYWVISYRPICWHTYRNPLGYLDYEITDGKRYANVQAEAGNVYTIPQCVETKAEVIAVLRRIEEVTNRTFAISK